MGEWNSFMRMNVSRSLILFNSLKLYLHFSLSLVPNVFGKALPSLSWFVLLKFMDNEHDLDLEQSSLPSIGYKHQDQNQLKLCQQFNGSFLFCSLCFSCFHITFLSILSPVEPLSNKINCLTGWMQWVYNVWLYWCP